MNTLVMTDNEKKDIDSQVEKMLDWAKNNQAKSEQLTMDATRLLACTDERMNILVKQGFFKRCWSQFSGNTASIERANTADLIQMQKISLRYLHILQENQLMMAHSMLSLKNNLLTLSIKEEETRNLIKLLAERTVNRFHELENRVDQLEISSNLQGWLLGLEERDYDKRFPTKYMRLFQVINDFYRIKKDNWNYNDLMFMRKAIRTVKIDPREELSLNDFITSLTDELFNQNIGIDNYRNAVTLFKPDSVENYSKFAIDNISSSVFTTMHGLKIQYVDRLDIVEELQSEINISISDALTRLLARSIKKLNVNLDYQFSLAETAIEILSCYNLVEKLSLAEDNRKLEQENLELVETSNENLYKKLFDGIKNTNVSIIQECISDNIDLNIVYNDLTPLEYLLVLIEQKMINNKIALEVMELLLSSGADADISSEDTPLIADILIYLGNGDINEDIAYSMLELLLKSGANINIEYDINTQIAEIRPIIHILYLKKENSITSSIGDKIINLFLLYNHVNPFCESAS